MQLHAQDFEKFAFNIGGGITTPLNPTANYVGLSGNFAAGARITDRGWKFYVESRYNYAWHNRIPTTFVPVTFGFRFN